jgi:RNA polymerase sigma-70 factor (ECF subfamily)
MAMVAGARTDSEDDDGFDAFFRLEHQRLVALGSVLCGDRETGRDVAQEALARTYKEWARVGRLERPGAWTRRVVGNLARDHARHRAVQRRRLPELARRTQAGAVVSDIGHDGEFWAAVATLPDRQRTAVALFYVGDRSISQVAEDMGVREGTVKTTLHQARIQLRELLSEDQT